MSPFAVRPVLRGCARDVRTLRDSGGKASAEYYLQGIARNQGLRVARAITRAERRLK